MFQLLRKLLLKNYYLFINRIIEIKILLKLCRIDNVRFYSRVYIGAGSKTADNDFEFKVYEKIFIFAAFTTISIVDKKGCFILLQ